MNRILQRVKGAIIWIKIALINDRWRVPQVSWKFGIPTICNFSLIKTWNLLFSYTLAYFLPVYIVFSVYKKTPTAQWLTIRAAMNTKISMFEAKI